MSRLYPCVYCTEDGYCKKYSDDEVTSWCVQSPCKDETPSNADRIRSMSDEELAEMFEYHGDCPPRACLNDSMEAKITEAECKQCWLDWLKQEVSDGMG